jgi:hypothetical protein
MSKESPSQLMVPISRDHGFRKPFIVAVVQRSNFGMEEMYPPIAIGTKVVSKMYGIDSCTSGAILLSCSLQKVSEGDISDSIGDSITTL